MSTPEEMQTSEELEAIFETDRAFREESTEQSIGRLAWMSARLRAEFTVTLFQIGIDENNIPAIIEAVGEIQNDYYDFVNEGLGASDETETIKHPLEEAFTDVVDELVDALDDAAGATFLDKIANDGMVKMIDLGAMEDEDILHKLNAHINRVRTNIDL